MLTPIGPASAAPQATPADPPRSPAEWANEALSWASPDGLIMHAVQPLLAQGMRSSGVGAGTEWGQSLQRVLDDPKSVAAFQGGFREGLYNGAKSLVEGVWGLASGVASAAYNTSPVGWAVDGLQKLGAIGDVPGWVPDASRVTDQATATGKAIGDYLGAVGHDPAKLGNDVKGWIAADWDGLKDSHAAAAAKGGAAEAQWWGQITGRATFEVAAIVVPATKFATVAKAAEALEIGLKAGKLGETFAEAARAGKLIELSSAAAKAGKTADLVAEARTAGRLPELVTAAKASTGGLQNIAAHGGITFDDIAKLEKAGTLTTVEAKTARIAEISTRMPADIAAAATRTGLSEAKILDVVGTAKPNRPLPASLIGDAKVARELARYDEGAVRFLSRSSFADRGTLGPPHAFTMPFRDFADMMTAAKGNLGVVEDKLGLSRGYLSGSDTMVVKIEKANFHDLELPSGNEIGANDKWLPGGYTSGGIPEATLNLPKGTPFTELHITGAK